MNVRLPSEMKPIGEFSYYDALVLSNSVVFDYILKLQSNVSLN